MTIWLSLVVDCINENIVVKINIACNTAMPLNDEYLDCKTSVLGDIYMYK